MENNIENQESQNEQIQSKEAIKNQMLLNEIFQAFFLDQELNKEQTEFLQQNFQSIDDFIRRPIDSPEDLKFKQMMAKILIVARQRGILPESIQNSLPERRENETEEERQERIEETGDIIATTVDESTERTKTDYKVGIGEMAANAAIDRMIDRGALKVSVFLDKAVDKGINWAITKGAVALSAMFPPAAPVIATAAAFLKKATPVIRETVKKGVKVVAHYAKEVAHKVVHVASKVVSTAKSVASKAIGFAGRVASGIASFFGF